MVTAMNKPALAALALVLAASPAHAADLDYYIGGFAGWGESRAWADHDPALQRRVYTRIDRHSDSAFAGVYGGLGWRLLALEGGWLTLPEYHSSVDGAQPKRHANQTIDGSAWFLRGLARAPRDWTVEPYIFAGTARVSSWNHEVGECAACGRGYVPDWRNDMKAWRPYLGAGAEIPIRRSLSARAEFGYIPRGSSSFWTGTRDFYLGSVALQWRF